MTVPPRTYEASGRATPREMNDGEVLATVGAMIGVLHHDDPDPELFHLIGQLPLSAPNLSKLVGAAAVQAAALTLRAAGIDTAVAEDRENVVQVSLGYYDSPDDVPDWEKAAGSLMVAACSFVLATPGHDSAQLDALSIRSQDVSARGVQFALLTLAEVLTHVRRLLQGDMRGVVLG